MSNSHLPSEESTVAEDGVHEGGASKPAETAVVEHGSNLENIGMPPLIIVLCCVDMKDRNQRCMGSCVCFKFSIIGPILGPTAPVENWHTSFAMCRATIAIGIDIHVN